MNSAKGADGMREYPKGGLIGRTVHLFRHVRSLHIPLYAANAGFFMILSLFPALVLVLSLLRYTGLQVSGLVELLSGFLPAALMGTVEELILSTYENSSYRLVGLSAVTAIWSASKGVYGLLTGLNTVYGVAEDRSWLHTRLISIFYTFLFFGLLLLTLVLQVFGSTWLHLLPIARSGLFRLLRRILDFPFLLLLLVQTGVFMLIFAFLPNGRNRLRHTVPGAALASLGWLAISHLFSLYVENFASLTNIYGSVYTLALAMLWLYFCLSLVFYSAAFNQYLENHKY
jgi:membrane protein